MRHTLDNIVVDMDSDDGTPPGTVVIFRRRRGRVAWTTMPGAEERRGEGGQSGMVAE